MMRHLDLNGPLLDRSSSDFIIQAIVFGKIFFPLKMVFSFYFFNCKLPQIKMTLQKTESIILRAPLMR